MSSPNDQEKGLGTAGKIKTKISDVIEIIKKNGRDDPRRITHSIKLGFALTLVSLFYYFRPLYDGLGQAGMWAILTVVVVFEFTVGGTLYKGLNRGFATFLAGSLGVGAEYLAGQCGETGEPIVLGLLVFLLATVSTFTRFIPSVKRRYDYGVLIFILTFSLVAVSGFRVDQILQMAHQRLSTIMLGGATCVLISIFVCPVWAGQDLHNLISGNLEKLADFLQGFGGEFFSNISGDESDDKGKSFLKGYKSVLASKQNEESLANFAWWEPAHGRFRFYHPWKLYLNIGNISRECACLVEILVKCIEDSKPQAESELQQKLQPLCMKLSTELGKTLKELSGSIKNMTFPSPLSEKHFQDSKSSADELGKLLESSSLPTEANLHEIAPLLTVASVLIDINKCVEKIKASVQELSENARFKNIKTIKANNTSEPKQNPLLHRGAVIPVDDSSNGNNIGDQDHVIIEIQPTSQDDLERKQEKA